jgi:hypothetical protein
MEITMVIITQFNLLGLIFGVDLEKMVDLNYNEREGHDGPEVAHLYKGPRSRASLNPRAFI